MIAAPAVTLLGCPVKTSCAAAAGVTVTVAVWVIPVPLIVAETTLPSATVALSVPVATPFASVVAPGCVSVFPVPVADSTTGSPLITLPNGSRTVIVSVLALPPLDAVIAAGNAVTLVCVALTGPGTVNPVNVRGDPTPVARTSCTLSGGVIAVPSVQLVVAMPLASVSELSGFTEPPPSSTAQLIWTLGTGLSN